MLKLATINFNDAIDTTINHSKNIIVIKFQETMLTTDSIDFCILLSINTFHFFG